MLLKFCRFLGLRNIGFFWQHRKAEKNPLFLMQVHNRYSISSRILLLFASLTLLISPRSEQIYYRLSID